MFGKKNKRAPATKGQGAAAAKQMGLFVDFDPEDMMDVSQSMDDPDLEAEFAAIIGNKKAVAAKGKKAAKAPLPMEDIEKMTEACMKDVDDDDDDDDNLEDDEDLLAELQEVVGEEETEDSGAGAEETQTAVLVPQEIKVSPVSGSIEHTLEERITLYRTAVTNAKATGESSKARRYERGLKTLQGMLASVRKGGKIDEAEIPPPVACGAPSDPARAPPPPPVAPTPELESPDQHGESDSAVDVSPMSGEMSLVSMEAAVSSEEVFSSATSPEEKQTGDVPEFSLPEKEQEAGLPGSHTVLAELPPGQPTKELLLQQQKAYRIAAVKAKQAGNLEQAKAHMRTSKDFDGALEALEKGQSVDMGSLPAPLSEVRETPPPAAIKVSPSSEGQEKQAPVSQSTPVQPKTVLEALEQRMLKYKEASAQAKASGDDRKARMHDRIAKQYQSAIRAHKAGRAVDYAELPTPPGFPPIPGQATAAPEQGFAAVLEAANKLASTEAEGKEEEEDDEEEEKLSKEVPATDCQKKPTLTVPPMVQRPKRSSSPSPDRIAKRENVSATATDQLEVLETRKKQYMRAALQAKQKNDLEQARLYLRTAKSLDPLIEAARSGKAVDISKAPSPPSDEDEDFILVHHSDVQTSEKAEEVYGQLTKILKEQYEKCMTLSKQFTHMGNVMETTKFEHMADRCKKSLEMVKLAQNRGLDPPRHHFEERTYRTVRIFPELSSTDMVVLIVRGMNLPAPQGVASNDLDAYVKFDFPYPSSDQPQKHKTSVIKNTNSPEYNQSFTLNINRNHRGFRRLVQSKGLKLEVLHKGGFLRSDKPVGTAQVKLEKLESESEVREIAEVMDGRKPTGGRLEVRVRLREPLSGQDVSTVTERWLVLDQSQAIL